MCIHIQSRYRTPLFLVIFIEKKCFFTLTTHCDYNLSEFRKKRKFSFDQQCICHINILHQFFDSNTTVYF